MTSLVSTDSSAPSLSSLAPDITDVLTGVRYIMETSVAQDAKLLDIISILTTQAAQIKERDQSIMIMQTKLDSQQAIIEEIRSEQRRRTSAVASFLESNAQPAQEPSVLLSPPVVRETPEPVTPASNPEKLRSAIAVPKLPTFQATPTPTFDTSSDTILGAHANVKTATAGDPWKAPKHYIKTQRGGQLRRQGAFYGTPDWSTMTAVSGGIPDTGAPPPSPPASPVIQEEVVPAAGNSRADVHERVEAAQEADAAAEAMKATASNDGGRTSDASSRISCKRCRDPGEQEARKTFNPMDLSRMVHAAPDWSSPSLFSCSTGPSPARGDDSNPDGPPKRRRLSQDIVGSDAVSDTKRPTRKSPRRVIPS
ncbi:hypothetical protein DEU56DRAFT_258610 [Suillus clintonianus]|uniref:uncharacterized protein n=1 Tax=Suillus clintonianus TaxID=1904413 RepID=UPI001B86AFB0|nr:uncharacterized protein DEU56DRAFT_258610 [Suillus clintonianus]KAG2109502.1 hypothetical protein DEU56DRAFT_258610 [Suillus clintonianus]